MPLTIDQAFLEDVVANPDDDAPRLIYADWLDDHGEPARAEFIRVQVESHRLPADADARPALTARVLALLQRHENAWRSTLPALDGVNWEDFSRGFVEGVFVNTVAVFLRHADAIFAAAPVRRLQIGQIDGADAALLARSAVVSRLTELNLGNNPDLGASGVLRLAGSSHLAGLRALLLHHNDLGNEAVAELAASPHLAALEELYLSGNDLGDDGVVALAAGLRRAHLTDLDLRDNRVGDAGVAALAQSGQLPALSTLYLVNNQIGADGASALAWSERLPSLARLYLNYNPIGSAGAVAFALSPERRALRDLDLRHADVRDTGGQALARSEPLDALDLLWLGGNRFRGETLTLLRGRFGPRLCI